MKDRQYNEKKDEIQTTIRKFMVNMKLNAFLALKIHDKHELLLGSLLNSWGK